MRWWCWRELRGDGDLPIYLEGGHLVQGTHNIDVYGGVTQGRESRSWVDWRKPELGRGVAVMPRAGSQRWWLLGSAQKHILNQTSPFHPE